MNTHQVSRVRRVVRGVSVAALVALVPGAMLAQSSNGADKLNPTKADELHKKAHQLLAMQQVSRWGEVAKLLQSAAALRQFDDPSAVEELALSGEMYHYVGQLSTAQHNLQSAAQQALENGQVLRSAELFLKAAFIAGERGQAADVASLARSAKQLAASPHLSRDECDGILSWLKESHLGERVSSSRK